MKKITALLIMIVLGIAGPGLAKDRDVDMNSVLEFDAVTVVNDSVYSTPRTNWKTRGFMSLHYQVEGTGTVQIEYQVNNFEGSTKYWIEPTGSVDVVSGFGNDSGPGSDGNGFSKVSIPVSKEYRYKLTVTGGSATVTAYGAEQ